MKTNMGTIDRVIRVIIAAVIALLWYNQTITGTTAVILMILAVIFVLTSLISFCPLYLPFKISTKGKDK